MEIEYEKFCKSQTGIDVSNISTEGKCKEKSKYSTRTPRIDTVKTSILRKKTGTKVYCTKNRNKDALHSKQDKGAYVLQAGTKMHVH
jgi:hypothetical protein